MNEVSSGVVRCQDGTEIPFEWAYPGADQFEWARDRAHWPQPATPMSVWWRHAGVAGGDRAWEEAGLDPPEVFRRFQMVGPFLYARNTMEDPAGLVAKAAAYRELAKRWGGARAYWERYCEPRMQQVCRELAEMPDTASLRDAAERSTWGFHQSFTCLSLMFEPAMIITLLLTQPLGETEAGLMAFELTQGGENATQAIDGEVADLAALARGTPAVKRILEDEHIDRVRAALGSEPDAKAFVAALDALIERHGARSQGWDIALPTWSERPEAVLELVRAQLDGDAPSPAEVATRSAERRKAATEKALAALPAEKHEQLQECIAKLEGYVSVREGRAYWQMVLTGQIRGFLLRVGARLVREGRIDVAEDVMFLTPDDIADGTPSDLRPLVRQRRAEHERWTRVVTPHLIGTIATPEKEPDPPRELRGSPASRGEVTGTARILTSPEEGARLQPGDVLVCVMTSPAWTPLFAIAGGIVTETGGPLSHPAITAREYGIPAVLAVPDATARIRDGQTVTLDGAKGVVFLAD